MTIREVELSKTMQVGDILLASWGYEANISDFYRVIKRTATTVTVEKLKSQVVGLGDFYDARRIMPTDEVATERNYHIDGDIWEPIVLKRKIKTNVIQSWNGLLGDYEITREYIQPNDYTYAHVWDGTEQIDYNHH